MNTLKPVTVYVILIFSTCITGSLCFLFDSLYFPITNSANLSNIESEFLAEKTLKSIYSTNNGRNFKEIRANARVKSFVGNVSSYAGFINVDRASDSNLFYWFFESENNVKNPLILWLQGGPGQSSLNAVFEENGPYTIIDPDDDKVALRRFRWTKYYNVLYIDNPVGAGYSYTRKLNGYSRTVFDPANNLYKGLNEFFEIYHDYKQNYFYLASESYGGKFVSVLADLIHRKNAHSNSTINLRGLFMGCGFIDPATQVRAADYMYELGMLDKNGRQDMLDHEEKARRYIKSNWHFLAQYHLLRMGLMTLRVGYHTNPPPLDASNPEYDVSSYDGLEKFIQKKWVRNAIHVGDATFYDTFRTKFFFRNDILNSVIAQLSNVLNHYKVLMFDGQYDLVVQPTQRDFMIENLDWKGKNPFLKSPRRNWRVNDQLAGYKKSFGNLTQVLVRNANHIITRCQPESILSLLRSFIESNSERMKS